MCVCVYICASTYACVCIVGVWMFECVAVAVHIATQYSTVDKMYQAEVLQEVVLHWGPRKEDPLLRPDLIKSRVSLIVRVLQSVSFIAYN